MSGEQVEPLEGVRLEIRSTAGGVTAHIAVEAERWWIGSLAAGAAEKPELFERWKTLMGDVMRLELSRSLGIEARDIGTVERPAEKKQ